jgi:tetratricopeptide (TPR) repeat protein
MKRMTMPRTRRYLPTMVISLVLLSMLFGAPAVLAQARQLSLADVIIALRSKKASVDEKNAILTAAVNERGITFELTPEIERELRGTGASDALISSIKTRGSVGTPVQMPRPAPSNVASTRPEVSPGASFYRERAKLSMAADDLNSSASDLATAIEMEPSDGTAHRLRGDLYVKLNDSKGAIESYTRAIEIASDSAALLSARAAVYLTNNKTTEALADYMRAAELDPTDQAVRSAIDRIKSSQAKEREAQRAAATPAASVPPPAIEKASEPSSNVIRHNYVGSLAIFASKLVMPVYTLHDKRMGIAGKVTVSVTLDEKGKVTAAKATDGPRQLWIAAENAVRQSKFNPVEIDGKLSTVSGIIVFNFTP